MCCCHVRELSDASNLFNNRKICPPTEDSIGAEVVELGKAQLTRQCFIAAVQLIEALGGGWEVETMVVK